MLNLEIIRIIKKIRMHEDLTENEMNIYIKYSITTHSGKLEGIPSISTACVCNKNCIARIKKNKKNSICCHCYADTLLKMRKTLRNKLIVNFMFYTFYEITENCVPVITSREFRFESFGDLSNVIQFNNYCTISSAKVNQSVNFALWTKNPWIIKKALDQGTKKPDNMKIIYSIEEINRNITIEEFNRIKEKYPFIDAVFVVCTKQYIEENNIPVICGGKSCVNECGCKCYNRNCNIKIITEMLK